MNRNLITFSANEQTLIKTGGINNYASNTVSYIVAEFDLGENWDSFDSVRAIFQSDFETAPAVLAHGSCVVPFEVLRYRSTVRVNLVGSVAENDVLVDRLTTFPITALNVTADALVDNSIAPISPSEFEQFVAMVKDDADRAEAGAESAEDSADAASASAQSAVDSALSASNSASDASASAQTAQEEAQKITSMVVVVTQLPEGATPTSDWSDGVLTIGIPKGDTGETGATGNGIESAVLNSNYTLTLTFTDGTSYTTPSIRGATGATGATGNGISSVTLTSTSGAVKTYTIAFTDGTNTTFDVTDGEVTQAVLDEEITALKADFSNVMYYGANSSMFTIGAIDSVTGTDYNSPTNRLRTSKFNKNIMRITAEDGYLFLVYAYSGNTFVGTWNGSSFNPSATAYVSDFKIDISLSYEYRIVVKRTDNADIALSESENIVFETLTDKTLTHEYKSADAKVVGDSIRSLTSALESISSDGRISMFKLADISSFTTGKAINGSGTVINESKSYCTEYFIDVTAGMNVSAQLALVTHTSFYQYVAFYDSTYTFISRVGGASEYFVDAEVPTNAKYCRITLSYVNTTAQPANVISFAFAVYYPLNVVTTSPKNKWYVLGDSISAGYYSLLTADVPSGITPAITYEDGTCAIWDKSLNHNYWGYVSKWFLNRELIGKAYPAQGYLHTASNSQNGVYVVKNNSFSDAGLITVAWGFNDWHYNMARGDHNLIDDAVPYPTAGYDTTQLTTINHAIWYCLGELIRKAPKAKIVVQTPMNGWRYGGDFSTNWGIGYSMSQSDTLKDIHDDIIYWCDYYGLQYIDMTFNNSIVNRVNIKDTIIDGSHPSDEAHKQLARSVWTKIGY